MSYITLDGTSEGNVSLDNESTSTFASSTITSLTLPAVPSSVLRTDAAGLVGGLNLTGLKRPRTSASGDDLDVANDIVASEVLTDGSGYAFVGPARVTGATTALSNLQISCGVADYGRLSFGTLGAGGFYIEQNGTALRFIRGAFGGAPTTIMTLTNAAQLNLNQAARALNSFYIDSVAQLEVQRASAGIRFRPGGTGAVLNINVAVAAVNRTLSIAALTSDQYILTDQGLQNCTLGEVTCDAVISTGTVTENRFEYNVRVGNTGYLMLNRSSNQLRFRPLNTGNTLIVSSLTPTFNNIVVSFPDPGAVNRNLVYDTLGQNVTFGDVTANGNVALGNAAADTVTCYGTLSVVGDATIGTSTLDTLTVNSDVILNGSLSISSLSVPSLTITTPAGGLSFFDGVDTTSFSVGTSAGGGTITFPSPATVARTVLYTNALQSFSLGVGSVDNFTIQQISGGADLQIPGTGLPLSLQQIYIGQDTFPAAGVETQFRIIEANSGWGATYSNGLIFRALANGGNYDRMIMKVTPTAQTTYLAAPVAINTTANSAYMLNLAASGTNFALNATSAAGGRALSISGPSILMPTGGVPNSFFPGPSLTAFTNSSSTWAINSDMFDAPYISVQNNDAGTAAGRMGGIRFTGSRGGGGADRTLFDLQVVRNTGATGEGVMYMTGRDTNIGGYTFRTSAAFGNPFCWLAPNTVSGWVGMLTQASPTAGYKFAIGNAGTNTTHSELNGNLIVRGLVDAPLSVSGTSNLTPAYDNDVTDPLRFERVINASVDTSANISSVLSLRAGAATAVPFTCDLQGHRDGTQARGGFRVTVNDPSAASGWWSLMDLTPRFSFIRSNPAYGAGVGGLTLQGAFLPSGSNRVCIGNSGSYDAAGATEISGDLTLRRHLTCAGDANLGDATSDTVTAAGKINNPLVSHLATTGGATNPFATKKYEANQGCFKTAVAAATQKVNVVWRLTFDNVITDRFAVSGRDHISSAADAGLPGNCIGESSLNWTAVMKPIPYSLTTDAGLLSTAGVIVATARVITLTLVSGSTYDLQIAYTMGGISNLYDTQFTVTSEITARTAIVTDVVSYTVTPTL